MNNLIVMEDVDGNTVVIDKDEFTQAMLHESVTLFGMDYKCLSTMKEQYLLRRGVLPITPQSIRHTFNNGS